MTIEFVTVDSETILNDLITQFETALGVTLYQGDERRIFLEQFTVVLVAILNKINETGKQNLLEFAVGAILDALGARTNCPREAAKKATVTMRFTLSDAQAGTITISAGTQVTPDGELFFATTTDLIIAAGSLYGDVTAEAEATGSSYNGFVAGQINRLVNNIAYVGSVANTTTSTGGSEEEADDDGSSAWSGYRERIRESPAAFSTAGPEDAYIYWAKTADKDIADVKATLVDTIKEFNLSAFQAAYPSADPTHFYTDIPGAKILLTVLMADGKLPDSTVLAAVESTCNADKRRPLTDYLTAAAPTSVSYDIVFTYYINEDDSANESAIRSAIEEVGGAIDQYKAWQCAKLGRAINPDELIKLVKNAGASRLVLTSPAYLALDKTAVALAGNTTITYGGLE